MNDLISKQTVIERMKSMAGCETCDNYNYVRCRACTWDDAMNIVEEMEPAVVKCRDCKWRITGNPDMDCEICAGREDWFCAGGEKN